MTALGCGAWSTTETDIVPGISIVSGQDWGADNARLSDKQHFVHAYQVIHKTHNCIMSYLCNSAPIIKQITE